jgi:hypothetical protein
MSPYTSRFPVPGEEGSDQHDADATAFLVDLYTRIPPAHLRQRMDHIVAAQMHATPLPPRSRRHLSLPLRYPRPAIAGMVSLATILVLVGSGLAANLRLSSPSPVSAQAILRHAVNALRLDPSQVAHSTYTVTVTSAGMAGKGQNGASPAEDAQVVTGGVSGTADVWVRPATSAAPAASTQTLSIDKAGTLESRIVQIGQHVYAYNPEMRGDNLILIDATRGQPAWLLPTGALDGASAAQEISALATQSPQQVKLLSPESLDGHQVDVIEVDGWNNRPAQRTLFYFDSASYVLRGFDAASDDSGYSMPSWQARLTGYSVVPVASVPAGTFSLSAPASAQVKLNDLGDQSVANALNAAFTAACHTGAGSSFKQALAPGQTPLAACQVTASSMTRDELVAALLAPGKAILDGAAAAGQITAGQEAASLATYQAWLAAFVTSPGGVTR